MRTNPVKAALKRGEVQIGCAFHHLRSAEAAFILGKAGIQWSFIDAEHGPFGPETLADICKASVRGGLSPIVRIGDMQYDLAARALDGGAEGILLPRIESADVLAKAISWMKFPPVGVRGYGLTAPAFDFEKVTIAQAIEHLNANTMVVFQIESVAGFEKRDELLAVPGVDAILVGPADLSTSLGIPGELDHPKLVSTIEKIVESAVKHGVAAGIHCRNLEMAKFWRTRGFTLLSCSSEALMLHDRASEIVAALK